MARFLQNKIEGIIRFGEDNRNFHAAIHIFNERFPERSICRKCVEKLLTKFCTTKTLKDLED